MSSRLVLADSSAWVSHLRGPRTAASAALEALLPAGQIATNEVIRLEVLTGSLDESQYAELADRFLGLTTLPFTNAIWRRAERLRFELRRTGHLVPVPDILIASCALIYGCELLHADKHFEMVARVTPLKVHHV